MLIFVRSVYARCLVFQVLLSSFLSWTPFTTHLNVMKGGQRKSLNHRKPITTIDHLHDNSPITTDINDSPIATDTNDSPITTIWERIKTPKTPMGWELTFRLNQSRLDQSHFFFFFFLTMMTSHPWDSSSRVSDFYFIIFFKE
jgi:hypothetical protein